MAAMLHGGLKMIFASLFVGVAETVFAWFGRVLEILRGLSKRLQLCVDQVATTLFGLNGYKTSFDLEWL